jgi:hypothetical protein
MLGKRTVTLLAVAALALGVAAVPAMGALSGPDTIKPGSGATFAASGLPKSKPLRVKLLAGGGGAVIAKAFKSTSRGTAKLHFNVPTSYTVPIGCNPQSVYNECDSKRWHNGQSVKVKVCLKRGGSCQSLAVRVKK